MERKDSVYIYMKCGRIISFAPTSEFTQLFPQEAISKSDQQSGKHRISEVKLTKNWENSMSFPAVKQI